MQIYVRFFLIYIMLDVKYYFKLMILGGCISGKQAFVPMYDCRSTVV